MCTTTEVRSSLNTDQVGGSAVSVNRTLSGVGGCM